MLTFVSQTKILGISLETNKQITFHRSTRNNNITTM